MSLSVSGSSLLVVVFAAILFCGTSDVHAQQAVTASAVSTAWLALPQTPTPAAGTVTGTVEDTDQASVEGAPVRLTVLATHQTFDTVTNADGEFRFTAIPAGDFAIAVTPEEGLGAGQVMGNTPPGGVLDLATIVLSPASEDTVVSAMSEHDIAEVEVKKEEHQRLLGILPNFGISYDWKAPPLDKRQKFELATRFVIDPVTWALSFAQAGIEQAGNLFPGYGSGPASYFKRFGATTADVAIGNELGGAVFPILFHQDPRYFWKGTGSVMSRTLYALSRAFVCRGDNGKTQPAFSGIAGDLSAGALSNLYYPSSDRQSVALTFENGAVGLGADAIGNVVQEFVFKFFTPGSRKVKPNVDPAPSPKP